MGVSLGAFYPLRSLVGVEMLGGEKSEDGV
jgi:hypothetical protein